MNLEFTGTKYIAHCSFDERGLPKGAGFRWDPAQKQWWTDDKLKAAKLSHHAEGDVKRALQQTEADRKATIAASRATDADVVIPCPEGLAYLPYQKAGIAFAVRRPRVLIGDDMGLGKTPQSIGIVNADPTVQRVLVICPASLRLNWYRELRRWLVRPMQIAIADSQRPFPRGFSIVIINYDILKKFKDVLREKEWDLLIVDECHYIKNGATLRAKMIVGCGAKKKGANQAEAIEPIPARRAAFLSGTPISNRPVELWPIIHYLDPQAWPSYFSFCKRFCSGVRSRFGWDMSGASNLGELQERLRSSIMVRRLKGDVLKELPPKRRQIIELPAEDAAEQVAAEVREFERDQERLIDLRAAVEMAKASDDPMVYALAVTKLKECMAASFAEMSKMRHATALAKVPYVIEHIKNALDAHDKVIVFGYHISVIDQIMAAFPGISVKMDGRDKMPDRQRAVDQFQANPDIKLIVGGFGPMGVGWTLVAAWLVIFAEIDWVPSTITQAEDRAHRIGQHDTVLVQHLVLEGSLDANMARKIVAKQDVIDRALDVQDQGEEDIPLLPFDSVDRSGSGSTRQRIAAEAASMTPDQITATLSALRLLAGMCDGARQIDGAGFNKLDARIGQSLAQNATLTPKQAALGRKIASKYKRQIGEGVVAEMWGKA